MRMYPFLALTFLLGSCSSRLSLCESEVMTYRQGKQALVEEKDFPIGAFTENREAVRLLLDRALIRLHQGKAKESLSDFCTAIDAIDYYRSPLLQEKAVQLLTTDQQSPYIAKPYESLFARLYAAFACYALGNNDDAFVFLKQALVQEDLLHEQEQAQHARSPLLAYLMGLHLERQNDFSQAALFYRRAYELYPLQCMQNDIQRVSEGKRSQATILCLFHQGVIPEKKSKTAPASIAQGAILETLLAAYNIQPALSSLSGIEIPTLPKQVSPLPPHSFVLDRRPYRPLKIEDLFSYAKMNLKAEIPAIAAQAAARLLLRRAAIHAVREKNAMVGDIADIFAFIANLSTQADTRMWKTLPQEIYFLRIDLSPGTYKIGQSTISLQSGDLYVFQEYSQGDHS